MLEQDKCRNNPCHLSQIPESRWGKNAAACRAAFSRCPNLSLATKHWRGDWTSVPVVAIATGSSPSQKPPHLLLSMSFYVSPHHLSLFFLSPPAVLVFNLPSPSLSLHSHQKPEQWQRCNYHRGSWYPRGGLTAWNGSAENNTKMLYSCKNIKKKMKSCCHVCFWLLCANNILLMPFYEENLF